MFNGHLVPTSVFTISLTTHLPEYNSTDSNPTLHTDWGGKENRKDACLQRQQKKSRRGEGWGEWEWTGKAGKNPETTETDRKYIPR